MYSVRRSQGWGWRDGGTEGWRDGRTEGRWRCNAWNVSSRVSGTMTACTKYTGTIHCITTLPIKSLWFHCVIFFFSKQRQFHLISSAHNNVVWLNTVNLSDNYIIWQSPVFCYLNFIVPWTLGCFLSRTIVKDTFTISWKEVLNPYKLTRNVNRNRIPNPDSNSTMYCTRLIKLQWLRNT